MIYADYGYYTSEYLGRMEKEDFERIAVQASGYIDAVTFGRAAAAFAAGDWRADLIKKACCAAADTMYSYEHGGGIASEENDGVKVSYVLGVSVTKTVEQRQYIAVSQWLAQTGLMAQGSRSFGRAPIC